MSVEPIGLDPWLGRACRALVVVVLALVVAQGVLPGRVATASGSASQALADGFRVAPGTRLLGGVVPTVLTVTEPASGWSAVLWVDSDAVSAVNHYATQAARLGFHGPPAACATKPVPSITTSHSPTNPRGFVCEANWTSVDANLHIVVTICGGCEHATSTAVLEYRNGGAESDAPLVEKTEGRTKRLTERQQRRARRATPSVGEAFTDRLSSDEFPSVVANSAATAPSFSLGHCATGDAEAILTVRPGKTKSVLPALLRQNTSGDLDGDPLRAPARVTVAGVTLTRARYGYYTDVLVVDDPSRPKPFVEIEWCND